MKKEILFVLLKDFADWEGAYIAPNLNAGVEPGSESKYIVKTVSVRKEPVVSIGGFKVLPDYGIHDIPADYAGIVLIGGMSWESTVPYYKIINEVIGQQLAEAIVPLVKEAIEKKRLVAGICNASVFLGIHGFLNHVNHTSNGLDYLKQFAGVNYTGENLYMDEPAVRAGNIITANGFATLEFCREILYALEADSSQKIERSYRMNKTGVWEDPEVG